jgi:hypothetical protein
MCATAPVRIFKFAGPHRQSLDDYVCDVWNIEAHRPCGKQTLTNLELVFGHVAAPPVKILSPKTYHI